MGLKPSSYSADFGEVARGNFVMPSVGEILRTQRKTQGREVTEIAETLCVIPSYVSSIEQDDLKSLPGTFFYRSFVKQYAAAVGLDYTPLRSSVEALVALEEPPVLPHAESRLSITLRTWSSKALQLRTLLLHPGKIGEWASGRQL